MDSTQDNLWNFLFFTGYLLKYGVAFYRKECMVKMKK